jgi:hypothetical protein
MVKRPRARVGRIEPLAQATGRGLSQARGTDLTVSHLLNAPVSCVTCETKLVRKAKYLQVQACSARSVGRAALRDPFGPATVSRGTRRRTLTILVHCAHCAGGHVLLDESAALLSVTFPTV